MARFRVGPFRSLAVDYGYVIQKKRWWGWSNICFYDYAETARKVAKELQKNGHSVEWYI